MKDRAGSHRENLELFFTRSSGAGLIIDMQNRVVFANSAAEILLGWTGEEIQGKNFFSLVNPSASTADGPIDDTVKGILDLEAVDYLPPLARVSTKSDRIRTASLKTAIVREEAGENRFLMILMQ